MITHGRALTDWLLLWLPGLSLQVDAGLLRHRSHLPRRSLKWMLYSIYA